MCGACRSDFLKCFFFVLPFHKSSHCWTQNSTTRKPHEIWTMINIKTALTTYASNWFLCVTLRIYRTHSNSIRNMEINLLVKVCFIALLSSFRLEWESKNEQKQQRASRGKLSRGNSQYHCLSQAKRDKCNR